MAKAKTTKATKGSKKADKKSTVTKKKAKTSKTTKTSKSKKVNEVVAPVAEVVEETTTPTDAVQPVVDATSTTDTVVTNVVEKKVEVEVVESADDLRLKELEDRMNTLVTALQTLRTEAQNIVVLTRSLKTDVTKMVKGLVKDKKKLTKKKRSKPRAPSGFAKPTYLSTTLCKFLDLPKETMLARTEVTRKVNAYIKEHGLQNPENKKEILPDTKLKKILVLEKDVPLTYFNLQKAIKQCFSSTPF
jgi:chromatin remodeling complex protein RSC6